MIYGHRQALLLGLLPDASIESDIHAAQNTQTTVHGISNTRLRYRRGTARRAVSIEVLSAAVQLYQKI